MIGIRMHAFPAFVCMVRRFFHGKSSSDNDLFSQVVQIEDAQRFSLWWVFQEIQDALLQGSELAFASTYFNFIKKKVAN